MKNKLGLHGLWRTAKFFVLKKPFSQAVDLYISVGFLISELHAMKKTIQNGIINHSRGRSKYWMPFIDRDAINIRYETIPSKTLKRLKLPLDSKQMFDRLRVSHENRDDIAIDAELHSLYSDFEDRYESKWPTFMREYDDKIMSADRKVRLCKSQALVDGIIKAKKEKWPSSMIFSAYSKLIVKKMGDFDEPIFKTLSKVYFWRVIRNAIRQGVPSTLIHDSFGIPREHQVKITGQIKAFIRIQFRHPKRLLIRKIIERVKKRFDVELSASSVKRLKSDQLQRNLMEWYSQGEERSRKNELPRLIRCIAEAPGEVYEADYYKTQFICKSVTGEVIRLWMFAIIDSFAKKIVGWSLDRERSELMAIRAFKMAFVDAGYLPEEIIIDNDKLYDRRAFKQFLNRINLHGVICTKAFPNMPTWKSNIEGFFGVWQKITSAEKWCIGDGITSKNKSGNVSRDYVNHIWKKKRDMLNEREMTDKLSKLLNDYNSFGYSKKKGAMTPNDFFKLYVSKRTIKFQQWMEPQLFWDAIPKKVIGLDGKIIVQRNNEMNIFQVLDPEQLLRYKGSYVRLHYNLEDPSTVHLFERGTEKYIGEVKERRILNRENKKGTLKQHRQEVKKVMTYIRSKRDEDLELAFGVSTQKNTNILESLDSKILKRKMSEMEQEREVAEVLVD